MQSRLLSSSAKVCNLPQRNKGEKEKRRKKQTNRKSIKAIRDAITVINGQANRQSGSKRHNSATRRRPLSHVTAGEQTSFVTFPINSASHDDVRPTLVTFATLTCR